MYIGLLLACTSQVRGELSITAWCSLLCMDDSIVFPNCRRDAVVCRKGVHFSLHYKIRRPARLEPLSLMFAGPAGAPQQEAQLVSKAPRQQRLSRYKVWYLQKRLAEISAQVEASILEVRVIQYTTLGRAETCFAPALGF